jgi:hypothetical protein
MQYVRVRLEDKDLLLSPQEIDTFRSRLDVKGFSRVTMQDGTDLFLSGLELENAVNRSVQNKHASSESSFIAKEQTELDLHTWNKTILLVGAMVASGIMLLFLGGRGMTGMVSAEPVTKSAGALFALILALLFVFLVFGFLKKKFVNSR